MKQRTIGISALALTACMSGAVASGVIFNFTDSAPTGLWIIEPLHNLSVKRGTLIAVCPPDSYLVRAVADFRLLPQGDCPGANVAPLLKPAAAVSGDVVRLYKGELATVNGITLPNTIAKSTLPSWPNGEYLVKPGEVWLFSSYSKDSFDSRYFGPVSVANIRGLAAPLLVNGNVNAITGGSND